MSHRSVRFWTAAALAAAMVSGCKKDKEAAVVEEVPAAAPPVETDTSATLAEEPSLHQVGKDKPGSAKNTFHPSGKGGLTPSADQAGFSDAGRFVVQVAIFKSKRQAAALVEKLSAEGYPAYVAEVENPVPELSGTYHRVRIGKFLKIADARAFGDNTLKPLGYDFWVDNKKNDGVGGTGGYSEPAPAPVNEPAETPAPRKAGSAPSEPSEPPSGTWGTPGEAPASESWSSPSGSPAAQPASELPGAAPAAASPAAPAEPPKTDTGKVNLDEW